MYLEKIDSPGDLKKIPVENLQAVADEVRAALINKISKAGGHQGPNLGVVELTVALHYVFDSPADKIVFDVSHQCYPHKILTGRKIAYTDESHFADVTGYTNPNESEHDFFTVGHTSTSVSLAMGLAVGRDVSGGSGNVIALIGDGSLSGGEAMEGLDTAGEYGKNLIIVVNDNDQSIAENHGGIYKTLKKLRDTDGKAEDNVFRAFGLDYRYLGDGHDVKKLVELFESVRGIDHPVVLHIHTTKGKGLPYAERERERFHAGGPFNVEDGSPKSSGGKPDTTVYDSLISLLGENEKSVILNAGTPMALGFVGKERDDWERKGRFIDVGIAEENAVAMAAGIAKAGGTPVFGTFAPFFQRVYDQMSHDVCLNSSPATFLILYPGVYGMNSNTHIALCDIQMFAHIPNLLYLAPTSKEEYEAMFRFATTQKKRPVAIRILRKFEESGKADTCDYSNPRNEVVLRGKKAAIFAVGPLLKMALEAASEFRRKTGNEITVVNPKFLSGVDETLLTELEKDHSLVVTIEDGESEGGYGSRIASFYGTEPMRVLNLGISKAFHSDFDPEKLLSEHGMSVENLVSVLEKAF